MSKDDHNCLCNFNTNLYYGRLTYKELHKKAYDTVLRIRGSNDAPAFDYCVEQEFKHLKTKMREY